MKIELFEDQITAVTLCYSVASYQMSRCWSGRGESDLSLFFSPRFFDLISFLQHFHSLLYMLGLLMHCSYCIENRFELLTSTFCSRVLLKCTRPSSSLLGCFQQFVDQLLTFLILDRLMCSLVLRIRYKRIIVPADHRGRTPDQGYYLASRD